MRVWEILSEVILLLSLRPTLHGHLRLGFFSGPPCQRSRIGSSRRRSIKQSLRKAVVVLTWWSQKWSNPYCTACLFQMLSARGKLFESVYPTISVALACLLPKVGGVWLRTTCRIASCPLRRGPGYTTTWLRTLAHEMCR